MISDVPGYTWGLVPVFSQAGVKYFSIGPNICDRIGQTLDLWQDKPFYWLAPDGRHKVLCWVTWKGYALCHPSLNFKLDPQLPARLDELARQGYPYDIVQIRWSIGGDNGPPDTTLPDVVRNWNAAHDSPKLVIATTGEPFRELERRYADKIPEFRGDWTPFWEDGAGSSSRETAVNRAAAERLVQAETLCAMLNPAKYPTEPFHDAWRNVMLYDEHTWGAYNSVSEPDAPFVKQQWAIKQAFALDAEKQAGGLLRQIVDSRGAPVADAVDAFNTSSWPRTDLVTLPRPMSTAGDVVKDSNGRVVPSQRLSTGDLCFLARNVPALAACRYSVGAGAASSTGSARAEGTTLAANSLTVEVDPATGAITSLKAGPRELVDPSGAVGLNQYVYLPGGNVKDAQANGAVQIRVLERGPLVASLEIASDAPGCNRLVRQIRVVDGLDRVELSNMVDKKAIRDKEGIHFGFGFRVPDGVVRMDLPWAVARPEVDQLPGACKNWFTVQRFVDISNDQSGVTWATIDAPLLEIGGLTANLPGTQQDPGRFLTKIDPSQTIYSWVMNNHWHTNYKADQEGPTTFRYAIRAHGAYDAGEAQRFGIEQSQPLVVAAARGPAPSGQSLLSVEPAGVIVSSIQPVDEGKQLAVRLFNATGAPAKAAIRKPQKAAGDSATQTIKMRPWEVVTLRVPAT